MPGFLLHQGATVMSAHAGQAQPVVANPRVKVSGQPTVVQSSTYTVSACPFTVGPNPMPCITAQWTVAHSAGHVFVKPVRPDLHTSATLVTSQRVYQLTLRASPENGKWYQRVRWHYPDLLVYQKAEQARRAEQIAEEAHRREQRTVARVRGGRGIRVRERRGRDQQCGEYAKLLHVHSRCAADVARV